MDVQQRLAELQHQDLYRQRRIVDSAQDGLVCVDDTGLINFSSNNYLGLANDPRVIQALTTAAQTFGVGSCASQLISGYQRPHYELEQALAEFVGLERAVLFSNGYCANLGIQQSFLNKNSLVILDRLDHASIIDGARLSGAKLKRYPHRQIERIPQYAARYPDNDKMIISESVFSMEGDVVDLRGLQSIANDIDAMLVIDDAHGFGVLGEQGRGILHTEENVGCEVDLYLATLGKSVGGFGAFVAGSTDNIDLLIQKSRSLIYTTAIPAALAAAALASLKIIKSETWRGQRLSELVGYFRTNANELEIPLINSSTPIQPIPIGDNNKTMLLSQSLLEQGFLVQPIRPPTVATNTSRLRITLSVNHTESHIDQLLRALANALMKL